VKKLSLETTICRDTSQVFSDFNGEVVMLNVQKGAYHAMNEVGSAIWNELSEPASVKRLIEKLISEYDVSEERCYEEVISFLNELLKEKIIKIIND